MGLLNMRDPWHLFLSLGLNMRDPWHLFLSFVLIFLSLTFAVWILSNPINNEYSFTTAKELEATQFRKNCKGTTHIKYEDGIYTLRCKK
jgi:hypothetical protein